MEVASGTHGIHGVDTVDITLLDITLMVTEVTALSDLEDIVHSILMDTDMVDMAIVFMTLGDIIIITEEVTGTLTFITTETT
jgi:hypothetical protein